MFEFVVSRNLLQVSTNKLPLALPLRRNINLRDTSYMLYYARENGAPSVCLSVCAH